MGLPGWFLESARALIRADSVSAVGNAEALEVLEPLYARAGLPTRRLAWRESIDGAPEALHANLLAGPGGLDGGSPWSDAQSRAQLARGEIPASARGGLLLVTHTDTVPPGPLERWSETGGDPRALTENSGWLFGLGVADVKLDALCKIAAAERLRHRKLARPFWLCGTAAEEVGLRGARRLAESALFQAMGVRQVLCGEPSELQLISAHKGYAVVSCAITDLAAPQASGTLVELDVQGKAAHSSTPQLGLNAIDLALAEAPHWDAPVVAIHGGASANTVPALCTLRFALADRGAAVTRPDLRPALAATARLEQLWLSLVHGLEPQVDARFEPQGAVGGLNVIASEQLPDGAPRIRATLDARLLPAHEPDALLAAFARQAQALVDANNQQRAGKLRLELAITRNAGGMALADDSPLVQRISRTLAQLGLDGTPRAKPTSTEAGVFARAGCEAVVLGPGRSTGNAHTANERIEVAQLEKAIDLYEALLLDLCSGPFTAGTSGSSTGS